MINNAFYAVNEKQKQNVPGYEPTVILTTKQKGDNIEIKVNDNGNGFLKKYWKRSFSHSLPQNQQDREQDWD